MILSFGPELTWLYRYLTASRDIVKSAKMHMIRRNACIKARELEEMSNSNA